MLYVETLNETEYSTVLNVYEANEDGSFPSEIAKVELFYDMGDTLAEVEVISGYLDEEQFEAICDGEYSNMDEEVA